jgi:hypothetical protein
MIAAVATWFCTTFALWSLMWWLITIGFLCFVFRAIDHEDIITSSICIFFYLIILNFVSGVPILGFIANHPNWTVLIGIGYIVLGIIWSFFKWYWFARKNKNEFLGKKIRFLKLKGWGDANEKSLIPKKFQNEWEKYAGYGDCYIKPLKVMDYKSKITGWIAYWPFSLIWAFFADFIKDLFGNIVELFKNKYQKVSDIAYKDVVLFEDDEQVFEIGKIGKEENKV